MTACNISEPVAENRRRGRPRLDPDAIRVALTDAGFTPTLSDESYERLIASGFRAKNLLLACVAAQIALHEKPLTLRGLMYRVVSAGILPSTDREHYTRLGRVLTTLRESGLVPFAWIVDNVRQTIKPSSWSGLTDFVDTVQAAYRKDFWTSLPEYVHVLVEKDALAGTLSPVTHEYDVALSPIRGYASLSFAHEIAETWNQIQKPIHAYYLGDFDASGFDLERDLRDKLARYCNRPFTWRRLGVNADDFETFDLIPLKPKKTDRRYKTFVREHGKDCAELDAIPPTELRRRVRDAITAHIPSGQWEQLQAIEAREKQDFTKIMGKLRKSKVA